MRKDAVEPVKSVGIWIRVSTEDQVRGESPLHHETRARAYAELKGWEVREVYRLEAVSGKSVMAHPEARRMLADVRAGHISGLVFSKLARLARNTKELLEFADVFRTCHADMISLAESIDTSTPAGRLFFTMIAAMAQWEREEIAERVRASVPIRAKLGKPTAGAPPFGYRRTNGKLEPDPDEAPVRKLIYELFVEHQRKKTVARLLNERGYRTRSGGLFTDTTLDRLIRDPTAKGRHRANYTRRGERTKSPELKAEAEWIWNEVPAVVSEDLWEQANGVLEARRAADVRRPAKKAVHLFAGFAFCACGEKMYVPHKSLKYVCQSCRNKIPTTDLEAVYRARLSQFLISPDEVDAHREAASEALAEKARLIEAMEAELKRLAAEEDRLFDLHAAGQLRTADFGKRHAPVAERRGQIEKELPRLEAERDVLRISLVSQEAAMDDARDLADRWEDHTLEERRHIVEAITDRIVIGKDDIEITLLDLPEERGKRATHSHGFMAAITWKRAG